MTPEPEPEPEPAGPAADGRREPGDTVESRPRDPDAPPTADGQVTGPRADGSDTTIRADAAGEDAAEQVDAEDADAEPGDPGDPGDAGDVVPGWLVTGLAGGGAVLAGSLLLDLRRRRRTQARSRLPGRAVPVPGPELAPVERTAHTVGGLSGDTVEVLDDVLRRLAASCVRAGRTVPPVAAVQVDRDAITLHLTDATALPDPWVDGAEQRVWSVEPAAVDRVGPRDPDQPAPYPLLVTLGTDDTEGTTSTWLLNLEDQTVHLTGPAGATAPATDLGGSGTGPPAAASIGSAAAADAGDRVADLARYWAAEMACHPWAAGVEVSCAGIAGEVAPMAPDRVRVLGPDHRDPVAQILTGALDIIDRLSREAAVADSDAAVGGAGTVAAARAAALGADTWLARALLVDVTGTHEAPVGAPLRKSTGTPEPESELVSGVGGSRSLGELLRLVETHAGRTGTTVVVLGDPPERTRLHLHVSPDCRARLDPPGLEVTAVGLSADEAAGCAALLAQSEDTTPVPIPETPLPAASGDDPDLTPEASGAAPGGLGWRSWANEAGGLRVEHTRPRHPPPDETGDQTGDRAGDTAGDEAGDEAREAAGEPAGEPAASVLPDPDAVYLAPAATTAEDLAVLAPRVPARVARAVEDTDPALDADVTAWFDPACDRPRLTLLGPVGARTRGSAVVVAKRKAFYTEVLAYLATRPHGATPAELTEDLGISPAATRNAVHIVREWLGTDPRTGARHLPDAREAPAAVARGVPAYQVVGLLVDADLFRRLRVRGQARGGEAGMADLLRALTLVTGRPLDRLRPGGWGWVLDGDRLDQHLVCAVVDVAHLVTTHHLRTGDLTRARHAAEVAALAGPYEEIPRLDLAAVAEAEGHHHLARRIARDEIANRSDDHGPPPELHARTERLLRDHGWLTPHDRRETT